MHHILRLEIQAPSPTSRDAIGPTRSTTHIAPDATESAPATAASPVPATLAATDPADSSSSNAGGGSAVIIIVVVVVVLLLGAGVVLCVLKKRGKFKQCEDSRRLSEDDFGMNLDDRMAHIKSGKTLEPIIRDNYVTAQALPGRVAVVNASYDHVHPADDCTPIGASQEQMIQAVKDRRKAEAADRRQRIEAERVAAEAAAHDKAQSQTRTVTLQPIVTQLDGTAPPSHLPLDGETGRKSEVVWKAASSDAQQGPDLTALSPVQRLIAEGRQLLQDVTTEPQGEYVVVEVKGTQGVGTHPKHAASSQGKAGVSITGVPGQEKGGFADSTV